MNCSGKGDAGEAEKPAGQASKAKRPYQKPAFRYEHVFEVTALACGKISATESTCRTNRKLS